MSNMRVTAFWEPKGTASAGTAPYYSLTLHPAGEYGSEDLQVMFGSDAQGAEMLAVADRVLARVQTWRNRIAEDLQKKRTAEDELAAAKARIAELEQAAERSDS